MSSPIQLGTMMCQVTDVSRAIAFYRDVIGGQILFSSPHWTSVQLGSAAIGLHAPLAGFTGNSGGWILGYTVTDIVELRRRLVANDVAILQDFHDVPGGVVLLFSDPDGNLLQAMQIGITVAQLDN